MSRDNQWNESAGSNPADGARPDRLAALLQQAVLAQAAALARSGRYAEAEAVLAELKYDASSQVLDLQAKIRAQQGKLVEAVELWKKAETRTPGRADYAAAQRRAARLSAEPKLKKLLRPSLIGAGFLLLFFAIVLLPILQMRHTSDAPKHKTNRSEKQTEKASAKRNECLEPKTAMPALNIRHKANDTAPAMSGVLIFKNEEKTTILFKQGLFVRGTRLRAGASELLTDLGKWLPPQLSGQDVAVIGCTDDLPMPAGQKYRDNSALALARAMVVAEALRAASRLPAQAFVFSSAGEIYYPYQNRNGNRARNRTAVIMFPAQRPEPGKVVQP